MLSMLVAVVIGQQADLGRDLRTLLADASLNRGFAGVFIKEIDGQALFEQDPDKRFIPASTAKLVSVAAALANPGPDYKLATYAWRRGKIVYLLGGADPGLTVEELLDLKARLKVRDSDSVIFDDSILGPDRMAPGWQFDDLATDDAPPVSGLTVNRGAAELWLSGEKLELRPQSFGIELVRTLNSGDLRLRRLPGSWRLEVQGGLPEGEEKKLAGVSLPDPGLCAARLLSKNAKRKSGLSPPPDALALQRRTIADVARVALIESDNHYAEMLLRLAGVKGGKSGSWSDSLAFAGKVLERIGIPRESYRLADGSGLSRFNEITPRALVQLLEWELRQNKTLFPSLMCVPGEGTLKNRLSGVRVWAKTGTMSGITCLVGYVDPQPEAPATVNPGGEPLISIGRPQPKRIAFAIMFNHYAGLADAPRRVQDNIVRRLSTYRP